MAGNVTSNHQLATCSGTRELTLLTYSLPLERTANREWI